MSSRLWALPCAGTAYERGSEYNQQENPVNLFRDLARHGCSLITNGGSGIEQSARIDGFKNQ